MLVGEEGKGQGCEEERGGIVREVTAHMRCWRKDGGQDAVEGNGAAQISIQYVWDNSELYNRALPSRMRAGLNRKRFLIGLQGAL